jgi:outer membrane receptor protein involved in Fe transport
MRLWSRFEDDPAKPHWVVTPYYRRSDMTFLQHFLPGTPLEDNGQESVGVQSMVNHYGERHKLSGGLDIEAVEGWLTQFQEFETQGSPFLKNTVPQGLQYDYDVEASQVSPFVQVQFLITPQTTATAGTRYERMGYDYDNNMLAGRTKADGSNCIGGCRYSRPADSRDRFSNWSHSLGLQHQINNSQRVALTFARGFRARSPGNRVVSLAARANSGGSGFRTARQHRTGLAGQSRKYPL